MDLEKFKERLKRRDDGWYEFTATKSQILALRRATSIGQWEQYRQAASYHKGRPHIAIEPVLFFIQQKSAYTDDDLAIIASQIPDVP